MTAEIAQTAEIVHLPTGTASLGREQLDLLKRTIARDLDDNEFALFAQVCQRTGLDPFMRQVHAVKRWSKREGRQVMSIQVGIDGYRLIADRTGKYAGNDDPVFVEGDPYPRQATVTVYKLVGGVRCPFTATARWSEYCPGDKQDAMWKRMPHVMLGKVAEALALRKAFPAELSGLYTDDEMDQATGAIDLPPAEPMATKHDVELLMACIEELEPEQRSELVAWKNEQGFSWPWSIETYNTIDAKLEEIVAAGTDEPVPSEEGDLPAATSDPDPEGTSLAAVPSGSDYSEADMEPFE